MATEDSRKLFMAGLPDSVTEEVLRSLFIETGAQVTELTLPRDRVTGRPRGFAFVRLGSQDEADRARQQLDGRIVDGKNISVRPFHAEPPAGRAGFAGGGASNQSRSEGASPGNERPVTDRPVRDHNRDRDRDRGNAGGGGGGGSQDRGGNAPDRTLYVGNLPYEISQENVESLLHNAGVTDIARVYLPVDQDGRKRGFGFVTMNTAEAANGAIELLKDAALGGRRLVINIAHPKQAGGSPGNSRGEGGAPFGDRPPRTFSGPSGFSGPPMGGGPPPPPRANKNDSRRRKDGYNESERTPPSRNRREREERWARDHDDEDW